MTFLQILLRPTVAMSFAFGVTFLAVSVGWGLLAGPRLMRFDPPPDRIGVGGLPLLIGFDSTRAASSTFRASLNGADVTDQLLVAKNGVEGTLYGFLEGENVLELAIYGEGFAPRGVWTPERRRFTIRYRPPQGWDRG